MLVNTALIGEEILIHSEGASDWTKRGNLFLDVLDLSYAVAADTLVLIVSVLDLRV